MDNGAARRRVIVELAVEPGNLLGSRAKRVEALGRISRKAKARLLRKINNDFRAEDPQIEVTTQDTIFPVLVVTTTESIIEKLEHQPGVKSISPAHDFCLVAGK